MADSFGTMSHYETVKEEAHAILDTGIPRYVPTPEVVDQRIRRVIEDAARLGDVDPKLLHRAGITVEPVPIHTTADIASYGVDKTP